MKKLSVADRIDRAAARTEEALADLLRGAENWSISNQSLWEIQQNRTKLLASARRYSRAVNALTRVRG
jgi:hypothetical protein